MSIVKGNFSVELLKHSVFDGREAITWLVTYERFIHAEVMTHRWSRNYSSSRAIPYGRMRDWTAQDPAMPLHLGSNRAGMQSGAEVDDPEVLRAELSHLYAAVQAKMDDIVDRYDPHKEIVNRYTEPWGWITGVMTMGRDQLMNFFSLRCSPYAHPNIQRLATTMARLYETSKPTRLSRGEWHTPFFDDYVPGDGGMPYADVRTALAWSVARCAWCSYNNPNKDATHEHAKKRHDDCVRLKHVTPLEHQLRAGAGGGLVPGFASYRSMIRGESAAEFDFAAFRETYGDRDYLVL